jgi:hypothetical protein
MSEGWLSQGMKGKLACDLLLKCDLDAKTRFKDLTGRAILWDQILQIKALCAVVPLLISA